MGPWFHVSKQAHLIINSYIFQFHANKQANLNQLLPMYSNAMQTESPFESITSYVFQFHANNHARSINECLCITIPCKQPGPFDNKFHVFQFHGTKQVHLTMNSHVPNPMQTNRQIQIHRFQFQAKKWAHW